jgi:hypothetical protein
LAFRQFDDLFDVIDAHNARATDWSDADNIMYYVAIFRESGVTANPRYAAAMNAIGAVDAWETRAPQIFAARTPASGYATSKKSRRKAETPISSKIAYKIPNSFLHEWECRGCQRLSTFILSNVSLC